jgi:hypothetical protein
LRLICIGGASVWNGDANIQTIKPAKPANGKTREMAGDIDVAVTIGLGAT